MHSTHISLIQKLAHGEMHAWDEVEEVYRPLILKWLRRYPLQACDVEDLVQEVMTVLVRDLGEFRHNGRVGAFRKWLRTTCVNLTRNYLRKRNALSATGSDSFHEMLTQLADPHSDMAREFDLEHDRMVVRGLLGRLNRQFEPRTLKIFQLHVVEGLSAAETAAQLDVSVASVHTAKSRVLRRLRQEAADYLEDAA